LIFSAILFFFAPIFFPTIAPLVLTMSLKNKV
jgi:hypothetical protein